MASRTWRGTCVPPGPSKKAIGCPLTRLPSAEKSVPLKAVCDPEDVANAVMGFIINDLATGQVIVVDGGMLIAR